MLRWLTLLLFLFCLLGAGFSAEPRALARLDCLLKPPQSSGTVGALLFQKKGEQLYVLLAREAEKNEDPKKNGTFSDLGGRINIHDGKSVLQNLIREVQEESMGLWRLSEETLLKKGKFFYKERRKKGAPYLIVLVCLLLDPKDVISQESLNIIRMHLPKLARSFKIPPSFFEKDYYLWINLADLMDSPGKEILFVRDITGKSHKIRLRGYFIKDWMENPEFKGCVDKLVRSLFQ